MRNTYLLRLINQCPNYQTKTEGTNRWNKILLYLSHTHQIKPKIFLFTDWLYSLPIFSVTSLLPHLHVPHSHALFSLPPTQILYWLQDKEQLSHFKKPSPMHPIQWPPYFTFSKYLWTGSIVYMRISIHTCIHSILVLELLSFWFTYAYRNFLLTWKNHPLIDALLMPLSFFFLLALAQVYEQQMFSFCLKWIFFLYASGRCVKSV